MESAFLFLGALLHLAADDWELGAYAAWSTRRRQAGIREKEDEKRDWKGDGASHDAPILRDRSH